MNTLAFGVCFAAWMMNGVLVTYLVDHRLYEWDRAQMGWLIGLPVLTGSLLRLPVGMLTDRYGGRPVYAVLMIVSALGIHGMSLANDYGEFLVASLAFGISGASFAVGVAYTSVWFPRERQGTALGLFGMGNIGAAVTSFGAPRILEVLTRGGQDPEGWRTLPRLYAALLVATAVLFWLTTHSRKIPQDRTLSFGQRLAPLRNIRVWRFGLYYFLVFGAFVALSQWLIPYYLNVYQMDVATAGMMAAMFSLPSSLMRAVGGWLSDRHGPRVVMYWVLGACVAGFALLSIPRMDIETPGEGIMAQRAGTVTVVTPERLVIEGVPYPLRARAVSTAGTPGGALPTVTRWHEPAVKVGDVVKKKQLVALGTTHIHYPADVVGFTVILLIVGPMMGMGMAAVYRHIPDYFPKEVGLVGGLVGVIGGLGGFVCPILFGYLLALTGVWSSCWLFLAALSVVCLGWMRLVISRMMREQAPSLAREIEKGAPGAPPS